MMTNDPNDPDVCNYKRIQKLCEEHEIPFRNQSLTQLVNELKKRSFDKSTKRHKFTKEERAEYFEKSSKCNQSEEPVTKGECNQSEEPDTKGKCNQRKKLVMKGKCNQCKKPVTQDMFHLDHIKALANGGTNKPKNMQVLCISCHADKTKA